MSFLGQRRGKTTWKTTEMSGTRKNGLERRETQNKEWSGSVFFRTGRMIPRRGRMVAVSEDIPSFRTGSCYRTFARQADGLLLSRLVAGRHKLDELLPRASMGERKEKKSKEDSRSKEDEDGDFFSRTCHLCPKSEKSIMRERRQVRSLRPQRTAERPGREGERG